MIQVVRRKVTLATLLSGILGLFLATAAAQNTPPPVSCAGGLITATLSSIPAANGAGVINTEAGNPLVLVVTVTNVGSSPVNITASQQWYEYDEVASPWNEEHKESVQIPPGQSHRFCAVFQPKCSTVFGTYDAIAIIRPIDGPPACLALDQPVSILSRACAGF